MQRLRHILWVGVIVALVLVSLGAWLAAFKATIVHGRTAVELGGGHGEVALLVTNGAVTEPITREYPRWAALEWAPPDPTLRCDPDRLVDWHFLGLSYVHYKADYTPIFEGAPVDPARMLWTERRVAAQVAWLVFLTGALVLWRIGRSWRAGTLPRQVRLAVYRMGQVAAIVFLLLGAVAAGAWVRGYYVADHLGLDVLVRCSPSTFRGPNFPSYHYYSELYGLHNESGVLGLWCIQDAEDCPTHIDYSRSTPRFGRIPWVKTTTLFPGLHLFRSAPREGRGTHLYIAHWLLIALSVPYPACWFFYLRKRCRRAALALAGHCDHCGYDLRAHKPGERCPECGTAITPKTEV